MSTQSSSAESAFLRKPPVRRNISPETILSVTRKIIEEQGLPGAQARPIAEGAGCSVGTLYNVFDSLDTLILRANAQTLREYRAASRATLDRAIRTGATPTERLVALARTYVDYAEANTLRWAAVFEFRRPPDQDVPSWYREETRALFSIIEEAIVDLPGVRSDAMRIETARSLWAAVHGVVALAFAGRISPIDASNVRRHVEIVVRAAASGLGGSAVMAGQA